MSQTPIKRFRRDSPDTSVPAKRRIIGLSISIRLIASRSGAMIFSV
jgi:hypothetical protein